MFPAKKIIIMSNQNEYIFLNSDRRNRDKYNRDINMATRIPDGIFKLIKICLWWFMKDACKLEFADNLWLPFLDKLHSDILVFAIITFSDI